MFSLELHKGEILGIGGLTDCGMHELGKALFGNVKPLYGEVKLGNGKKITSEKQAIKNKIGYVIQESRPGSTDLISKYHGKYRFTILVNDRKRWCNYQRC